jgi:hypothetical protein
MRTEAPGSGSPCGSKTTPLTLLPSDLTVGKVGQDAVAEGNNLGVGDGLATVGSQAISTLKPSAARPNMGRLRCLSS